MLTQDDLLIPFLEAMKPKERWRIGAEAEKFGVDSVTGAPIPYEGPRGVVTVLEELATRFGWQRVAPEQEGGPLIALTRDHASVTLEPGAQLELSGAPLEDIHAIARETAKHHAEVRSITGTAVSWLGVGFHPFARQEDLPWVPKLRYAIMKAYLPTRGARPLDMMRRTATVQANFDYASEEDAIRKLKLALKLSPVITAMTANSPFFEGKLTGHRSERTKVWLAVDPDRQGLLPQMWKPGATIRDYVAWALDVPMFLFKRDHAVVANTGQTFRSFMSDGFRGHKPDVHDWEMHLNTLFPEVRLKNTLEVRGADSQPERLLAALPAVWTGILYDEKALAEAEALSESWQFDEMQALRPHIATSGLLAAFRGKPLADVAQAVVAISRGGLARRARLSPEGRDESIHLDALAQLTEAARCPADALLDGLVPSAQPPAAPEIIARARI